MSDQVGNQNVGFFMTQLTLYIGSFWCDQSKMAQRQRVESKVTCSKQGGLVVIFSCVSFHYPFVFALLLLYLT